MERGSRACPSTRWPGSPACPSTLGSPKLPQASRGRTEIGGDICLCPLGFGRRPPASKVFPQEPPNPRRGRNESCSPASPKPSLKKVLAQDGLGPGQCRAVVPMGQIPGSGLWRMDQNNPEYSCPVRVEDREGKLWVSPHIAILRSQEHGGRT